MTDATAAVRKTALTTWEGIWYVLQNIALGAGYFGKIPAKKAMADFGLTDLTGAEHFWYVVMCILFGAGYFAKIPTAKALSELPQFRAQRETSYIKLSEAPSPSPVPNSAEPGLLPAQSQMAAPEPAEPVGPVEAASTTDADSTPERAVSEPEQPREDDK